MSTQEQQFLNIRDLVIEFRNKGRKFQAVKGINFDINKGEIFGLVGESGSGKTTIGRAIVGVQPVKDGTIYLEGQAISGRPTNLYALNKEIYKRLKNIELKTVISTTYINNFLNSLKRSYENFRQENAQYTSEGIAKVLKNQILILLIV
ncbi:ATP-binding cassette domain-containing protein [Spiroplasma clarkii]|uniref:ATP-binding cassette domain-containing protein n=1 Tax=Spiroplasma clarkii TaxID=2139 RepID=UPI0011BA4CC9|nr:ATP-binding cassette domain-containing protein [Spiroplasma clarkii]